MSLAAQIRDKRLPFILMKCNLSFVFNEQILEAFDKFCCWVGSTEMTGGEPETNEWERAHSRGD